MAVISCSFVVHLLCFCSFVVSYESRSRDFRSHLGRLNVYTKTEITLTEILKTHFATILILNQVVGIRLMGKWWQRGAKERENDFSLYVANGYYFS